MEKFKKFSLTVNETKSIFGGDKFMYDLGYAMGKGWRWIKSLDDQMLG